jgi:predicted RNA-binding Zn-ribbon protein involved in translation (DUF1610 family)
LKTRPRQVDIAEELSSCPQCGGEKGFHVSFRREAERRLAVILVCPTCGFRFAVGAWTVPTGEPRPFDPSIDSGP